MKSKFCVLSLGLLLCILSASQAPALDTVIGKTGIALNGEREHVRTQETNLGNLVCDAIRYFTGADMALYNGGGIRSGARTGEITLEQAMEILAFDNEVVILEVSGSDMFEILEYGVGNYGEVDGRFPQVSGFRFYIDPAAPVGERVTDIIFCGLPIDPEMTYSLATNGFLASGGDGYSMLKDAVQAKKADKTDQLMFIRYLQEFSPVFPMVEGRIAVKPDNRCSPHEQEPNR